MTTDPESIEQAAREYVVANYDGDEQNSVRCAFLAGVSAGMKALMPLISELMDGDACQYDHHGYCQSHSLAPRPCPHERAKEIIKPYEDEMVVKHDAIIGECRD